MQVNAPQPRADTTATAEDIAGWFRVRRRLAADVLARPQRSTVEAGA